MITTTRETTAYELSTVDYFDILQAEWRLKKAGEAGDLFINVIDPVDHETSVHVLEITGETNDFWLTVNAVKFAREAREAARQ